MPARSIHYDSAIRDYSVDESLNRMEYFSNSVMEDSYDAAVRSRSRDQALLRDANATIGLDHWDPLDLSQKQEGVYYRPVVSTSGLHASQPPMPSSFMGSQQDDGSMFSKDNAGKNEDGSSAEDAKKGGSVKLPAYYACGGDPLNRPVTEIRRKMRRMVAAGKRNPHAPNYYRMGLTE